MSTPNKPRGGATSKMPLALLKGRTAEEREWAFELRHQKNSVTGEIYTNAECRGEIRERLGISLGSDGSYSDFCSWQFRQRQWDRLNAIAEDDEQRLADQFPGLSRDKIREAAIKRQYATADLLEDPSFMLKVIKVDQAESTGRSKGELEKEKLQLAKEAEARQREEHKLNREKFEDDASARLLKLMRERPEVFKQIAGTVASNKLTESQKVNAIRQRLFGSAAPTGEPVAPAGQ